MNNVLIPVIPGLNDAFGGEHDRNHTLGTRIANTLQGLLYLKVIHIYFGIRRILR